MSLIAFFCFLIIGSRLPLFAVPQESRAYIRWQWNIEKYKVLNACSDNTFLHLLMQKRALDSLPHIFFIWYLKLRCWSRNKPRNLIAGTSEFEEIHSSGLINSGLGCKVFTSLLLKNKFRPSILIRFSGLQNMEYLVLPGCSDNLFDLNHSPSFWNSRFTCKKEALWMCFNIKKWFKCEKSNFSLSTKIIKNHLNQGQKQSLSKTC